MSDDPYRLGHFLLGIEGLALLRGAHADEASRRSRVEDIATILERLETGPHAASRDAAFVDTASGYDAWASTYDQPGNVTVALEQSIVWPMLDGLPRESTVLDAACGTGRHAVRLADAGHTVIGVDSSEAMLEHARAKLPGATFHVGELERIPLASSSVDAVVCALALSHARDLRPGVDEIARVVRPGGCVIVSNPHPFATSYLNWRATVISDEGERLVIPEYAHSHSDSIAAFRAAGLEVLECVEGCLSPDQAAAEAKAYLADAFREALTGAPVVVVWRLVRQ